MALPIAQQIDRLIQQSNRILICIGHGAGTDATASALGLTYLLDSMKKKWTLYSADKTIPAGLREIPRALETKFSLEDLHRLRIEVDLSTTPVKELTYETQGQKLAIILRPKSGAWSAGDVKVIPEQYVFDLIISIGGLDRKAFPELLATTKGLLYDLPHICLDYRPAHEQFGTINLIDLQAKSQAETCTRLWRTLNKQPIPAEAATLLLIGILDQHQGFLDANLSPGTLDQVKYLLECGAKQQEAISRLYKIHTIPSLRLWGRALARLRRDEHNPSVAWCALSSSDLLESGIKELEWTRAIEGILSAIEDVTTTACFLEQENKSVQAVIFHPKESHIDQIIALGSATKLPDRVILQFNHEVSLPAAQRSVMVILSEKK